MPESKGWAALLAIIGLLPALPTWIAVMLLTCTFTCGLAHIVVNGAYSAEVITALKN